MFANCDINLRKTNVKYTGASRADIFARAGLERGKCGLFFQVRVKCVGRGFWPSWREGYRNLLVVLYSREHFRVSISQ